MMLLNILGDNLRQVTWKELSIAMESFESHQLPGRNRSTETMETVGVTGNCTRSTAGKKTDVGSYLGLEMSCVELIYRHRGLVGR